MYNNIVLSYFAENKLVVVVLEHKSGNISETSKDGSNDTMEGL